MAISIHVPPPAEVLEAHFPPRGCSSWLTGVPRDKDVPAKAALVPEGHKGKHGRFPVRLPGVLHAFLSVLIKILCDLFTANTTHYAQAGRNNQLVFQGMIFSQEPDVEHSQF